MRVCVYIYIYISIFGSSNLQIPKFTLESPAKRVKETYTSIRAKTARRKMTARCSTVFTFLVLAVFCSHLSQVYAANEPYEPRIKLPSSPFSEAIKVLQDQIRYKFESVGLLRRAMTHPSYSGANNKALGILGTHIIETAVSLHYLGKDLDTSAGDLNRWISEISKVDSSCATDGRGLGLEKVVRVSSKMNSSIPGVVCGAFRAMIAAIALDSEKFDDAGRIFWTLHHEVGKATVL